MALGDFGLCRAGSLATELRIRAHTPTLPTLKMQIVLSHYPPDLVLAHIALLLG